MCGIIGYAGDAQEGKWGETYSIASHMLTAASERGIDATGFAAFLSPHKHQSKNRVLMEKAPVPAEQFIKDHQDFRSLRHHRARLIVGHCRWATAGEPVVNRNNHPHVGSGFYLCHNGIISAYHEIAQRHSLTLKTDCDSEVLLRLLEVAEDPVTGLLTCMEECERADGTMAVAVLDEEHKCIWLARDDQRPLWFARLMDGRAFFASTHKILVTGLREVFGGKLPKMDISLPLAANAVYRLTPDGRLVTLGSRIRAG